jgi:hypothetical protein
MDFQGANAFLRRGRAPEREAPVTQRARESSNTVPMRTVNCWWHSFSRQRHRKFACRLIGSLLSIIL